MLRKLGRRGLAAVLGIVMCALPSSGAWAQQVPALDVQGAVTALEAAKGAATFVSSSTLSASVQAPATAIAGATKTVTGMLRTVSGSLAPTTASMATEAAWLYRNGWPLYALVDKYATDAQLDEQRTCLATAVYFEARGESAEGQLAVAQVVINRAKSGKYPATWCDTIKQPWQFSFVRGGRFPAVDTGSLSWRRAQAVAELAANNIVPSVPTDCLWYHADYVAPAWGQRLQRVNKIGTHIFYRA